jgi:parallel beta-helix repeat protein
VTTLRSWLFALMVLLQFMPAPAFAQFTPPPIPFFGTLNVSANRTLTRDVVGRVVITADHVTLDCAGHTISASSFGGSCGTGTGDCGIIVDGRSDVRLLNCEVRNHGIGIWINASYDVDVESSLAEGNGAGFRVEDSDQVDLQDSSATDNDEEGFVIRDSTSTFIWNNVSSSNGRDGFDENGGSDTIYLNNVSTGNVLNGFELDDHEYAIYWGNEASNNGQHGISLDGINDGILTLNDTVDNGQDGLRLDDFAGVGTIDFDVVQNYSEGNGDDAAQECDVCTGNTYTDNTFIGSTPGIP